MREARTQPFVSVVCGSCGAHFELATRNELRYRTEGRAPTCALCRGFGRPLPPPTEKDRQFWLDRVGLDEAQEIAGMIWSP